MAPQWLWESRSPRACEGGLVPSEHLQDVCERNPVSEALRTPFFVGLFPALCNARGNDADGVLAWKNLRAVNRVRMLLLHLVCSLNGCCGGYQRAAWRARISFL